MASHVEILSREFSLQPARIQAAVELLDAGNTIPFIARYRKEATGSMDDQVLREMAERLEYLRNMDKRRQEIEKTLAEQEEPGPPWRRNGGWNRWRCG